MLQSLIRTYSFWRVNLQHFGNQVDCFWTCSLYFKTLLWERGKLVAKIFPFWKGFTWRFPKYLENFKYLSHLTITFEKWISSDHLGENAPRCPNINLKSIALGSKHELRCSIPKTGHISTIFIFVYLHKPGLPKVTDF